MRGKRFLKRLFPLLMSGVLLAGCGKEEKGAYEWNAESVASSQMEGNQEELKAKEDAYREPKLLNPGNTHGKEIVTLGVTFRAEQALQDMVEAYNAQSEKYYVQLLVYERELVSQYKMDLLMGNGTDLYEISDMSIEQMTNLGVLEDLTPYFAQSQVTTLDNLLPCVRKMGTVGEKFTALAPEFYVLGLMTEKGITDDGTWTVEDFLSLAEKYPGSGLTSHDKDPVSIFLNVLHYEVDRRVDWESKTCDFASESFKEILEKLSEISKRECKEETAANQAETLYKREQMVLNITIGDPWKYAEVMEAFGSFGEMVGYPSDSKEPVYRFYANEIFGINSASEVKAGAWDFLEYWLSEEIQYATFSFPARRDVFEKMLSEDVSPRNLNSKFGEDHYTRWNNFTGEKVHTYLRLDNEAREKLWEMVEHAEFINAMNHSFLQGILFEELQAYFAGDKTVEDVTDIIQNRISLYLKERG